MLSVAKSLCNHASVMHDLLLTYHCVFAAAVTAADDDSGAQISQDEPRVLKTKIVDPDAPHTGTHAAAGFHGTTGLPPTTAMDRCVRDCTLLRTA